MFDKEKQLGDNFEVQVDNLREYNQQQTQSYNNVVQQKEQIVQQYEKMRQHNDQLKQMLQFKDEQLKQQVDEEETGGRELDRLRKDNKELNTKFSKAEFDAKKLVRIVKQYSEKNEKLQ